jgi:hypothetical protein
MNLCTPNEIEKATELLDNDVSENEITNILIEKHLELHGDTFESEFGFRSYTDTSYSNAQEAAGEAINEAKKQIEKEYKEHFENGDYHLIPLSVIVKIMKENSIEFQRIIKEQANAN